jgi:hypothetical protein
MLETERDDAFAYADERYFLAVYIPFQDFETIVRVNDDVYSTYRRGDPYLADMKTTDSTYLPFLCFYDKGTNVVYQQ